MSALSDKGQMMVRHQTVPPSNRESHALKVVLFTIPILAIWLVLVNYQHWPVDIGLVLQWASAKTGTL
jgi:hypothetical protein